MGVDSYRSVGGVRHALEGNIIGKLRLKSLQHRWASHRTNVARLAGAASEDNGHLFAGGIIGNVIGGA